MYFVVIGICWKQPIQESSDRLLVFHTPDPQQQIIMLLAATDPRRAIGQKTRQALIDSKSDSFYSLQLKLLIAQLS